MYDYFKSLSKEITESQKINRKILRHIINSFKGKTLDVGCGELMTSLGLKKKDYVGIDFIPSKDTDFVGDIHKLPFENESFDNCICNTVLEHVEDPEQVMKEIYRILKRNGKLLVSIPFLQEYHPDPEDYRRFTPVGFKEFIEKKGFKVLKIYGDSGILNVLEYLSFGGFVRRIKLGSKKNFPLGYFYIVFLGFLFFLFKFFNLLFRNLQKDDSSFITMIIVLAEKK